MVTRIAPTQAKGSISQVSDSAGQCIHQLFQYLLFKKEEIPKSSLCLDRCASAVKFSGINISRWAPWYKKDVKVLEGIERKSVKMIMELGGMSYGERLSTPDSSILEKGRCRCDFIALCNVLRRGSKGSCWLLLPGDRILCWAPVWWLD